MHMAIAQRLFLLISPVLIFLGLWTFLVWIGSGSSILPYPDMVFADLWEWIIEGAILSEASASLYRVFSGFIFGMLLAVVLGVLTARYKIADRMLSPVAEMLRPIPPLAWIPLSILWFGIGDHAAAFLVALGTFFPVFSGMRRGIASIQPWTVETGSLFELSKARYLTEIAIPQALPAIISSMIVGMGVSWMIVITAELVGVQSGLGYVIQVSRIQLDTERVISGMLVIGTIGFILTRALKTLERLICPWIEGIDHD